MDYEAFSADDFSIKDWINRALTASAAAAAAESAAGNALDSVNATSLFSLTSNLKSPTSASATDLADPFAFSDQPASSSAIDDSAPAARASTSQRQSSLDTLASHLVNRLQLHAQELSSRLDGLADEAVRSVPRILHDIGFISRDGATLGSTILAIQRELDAADRGVSHAAFDALLRLETVRSRMEASRSSLREAENWNTLTAELEAIFAAGDLERAGIRLREASRSLSLLHGTPDYDERRKLLIKLQNQLEAALGPRLITALTEHDAEAARRCYFLFEQIQRTNEFSSYYHKTRKSGLVTAWKALDQPSVNFVDGYTSFLKSVLGVIEKERAWCPQIFPNPTQVLITLLHQIFQSLKPSLSSRLETLVASDQEQFLPTLIRAYQATLTWGSRVESVLDSLVQDDSFPSSPVLHSKQSGAMTSTPTAMSAAAATAGTPTTQNNVARRTSAAALLTPASATAASNAPTPADPTTWGHPIFEAFLPFQQSYASLEAAHLSLLLAGGLGLRPGQGQQANEMARVMNEQVGRWMVGCEAAVARCAGLTAGFGCVGLVEALNAFVGEVVDALAAGVVQVRIRAGLEDGGGGDGGGVGGGASSGGSEAMEQVEWENFQTGLKILSVCRNLTRRMRALEGVMVKCVRRVKGCVSAVPLTPGDSLVELREVERSGVGGSLESMLSTTSLKEEPAARAGKDDGGSGDRCETALALLRLSTLNSYRLHQLIASVDDRVTTDWVTKAPSSASPWTEPRILNLLSPALPALKSLTLSAQRLIFDSIFSSIERQFAALPTFPEWSTPDGRDGVPEVMKFSMSQLPYITQIGESLLTLPQRLEIHAGEDGIVMAFAIRGLPYLEEQDFVDEVDDAGAAGEEGDATAGSGARSGEPSGAVLDDEDVTHFWITSVARASMASYLSAILRIRHAMGNRAARQLATDVAYIIKVFEAMDVEPIVGLRTVAWLMDLEAGEFRAQWDTIRAGREEVDESLKVVWKDETLVRKLAALRGITL
ncbi:hypothetical protein HK101_000188 [Irineochytrium annulatum]|nr:hypothetical protein HK101_000188 [Irineochytrium annulatum]